MKPHKAVADAGEAIRFNPRRAYALLFRSEPIDLRIIREALHKSHQRRCEPGSDNETQETGAQERVANGRPFEGVDDALAPGTDSAGVVSLNVNLAVQSSFWLSNSPSDTPSSRIRSSISVNLFCTWMRLSTEPPEVCRVSRPVLALSSVVRFARSCRYSFVDDLNLGVRADCFEGINERIELIGRHSDPEK
jgi:hypothetical protein